MIRFTQLLAVLALASALACRPSTSTQPRSDPDEGPSASEGPAPEPNTPKNPGTPDNPDTPDNPKLTWSSLGASRCEVVCAEVHACVLVEGERDAAEAAAIELGCLDACVSARARARDSLIDCERPTEREPETCAAFLDCARDNWPEPNPEPDPEVEPDAPRLPIDFSGRGCERACRALAYCVGDEAEHDQEAIGLCRELCIQALTPELERIAGECTELPTCAEVEACITSMPGA